MIRLKALGYWSGAGEPERWVSPATPQAIISVLGPVDPDPLVLRYLREGHVFQRYRGWSWCRLNCGVPWSEMGDADLTDGTWVWPQGLEHYVATHGLPLPDEFSTDVRTNRGSVPALPFDPRDLLPRETLEAMDYTFWNDWFARLTRAGE